MEQGREVLPQDGAVNWRVIMERVIEDKIVVARKPHLCDASLRCNLFGYTAADCETDDQRLMVESAEADKWRILPGQLYRK